ncbi:hypothetical protein G9F73_012625 [Clostridium estertheticum]|uniref:hypothetical protein n=1 Tax=Clostridium estertheticum TaxID=238834 RepID=UPI0013EED26A|nr:hypothetical protein [Clostridium estertheticum]MBZ9608653.1 hypothetical protein [Clostridium estertheticum]
MNKKIWKIVNERSEGYCEYPTDNGKCFGNQMCQQHHVFGKYNRKRLEMAETVYTLCYAHHLDSSTGVHFNKENRERLEDIAKEALRNKGWTNQRIAKELYGDAKEYRK